MKLYIFYVKENQIFDSYKNQIEHDEKRSPSPRMVDP